MTAADTAHVTLYVNMTAADTARVTSSY
jgi:hypothetical protein